MNGPSMRAVLAVLAGLMLVVSWPVGAALPRAVARAFLEQGVPLNAVAIVVQDTAAPRPLFAHQPTRAMSPASTMKLVTTFAALDLLGPDYRWRTEAYLDGPLEGGVLRGNLVLEGHGDPKITIEQWQTFMNALRAAGLDRIAGDLVLDRTRFDVARHDPGAFDNAPLRPYNVGPDALLVNFKTIRFSFATPATATATTATPATAATTDVRVEPALAPVHVGSPPGVSDGPCEDWRRALLATVDDRGTAADVAFAGAYPASCGERDWNMALLDAPTYAHAMFTTYFRAAGGAFSGSWREGRAPAGRAPFAVLESPPLYDIVRDVNKLSNNVMARQIFLTLSWAKGGAKPASVERAGASVRAWLRARRIAMPQLVLENGSGLSRGERVSARGLARLLVAADKSPARREFESSLAVAATDGTVERRFQEGGVAGQALLKTGTLEGVRAIAGYVLGRDGRRYVVVAIVNHPRAANAQPALDFLVEWVYAYGHPT